MKTAIQRLIQCFLKFPPLQVCVVLTFLVACGQLLGRPAAHLPAQVHDGGAGDFFEDSAFDVVVESLLANSDFRMGLKDRVR